MPEAHFVRTTKDLGPRARATMDLLDLYYRAEIAEALLQGKAPRSNAAGEAFAKQQKLERPVESVASIVLRHAEKMNREQRRATAKAILADKVPKLRRLSKDERKLLKDIVDPDAKQPLLQRMALPERLLKLLGLDDVKDQDEFVNGPDAFIGELTSDYFGHPILYHHDGRPDDEHPEEDEEEPTPPPVTPVTNPPLSVVASELQFVIEALDCIETTTGEFGPDEISFDGIATDFSLLTSNTNAPARVQDLALQDSGRFSDGDARTFTPDLIFARFDLTGNAMPHFFDVTYVMAETDPAGGLAELMNDLSFAIRADLGAIVTGIIGLAFSSGFMALSVIGVVLSAITGSAVALAISIALVLISPLFIAASILQIGQGNPDDVFDITTFSLVLNQEALSGDPFNGSNRTATMTRQIEGDGGTYRLVYHWELVGGPQFTGDQDEA